LAEKLSGSDLEEVKKDGFPFMVGGLDKTKTDCKWWGEVTYGFLTVPGCTKNYLRWCKFFCKDCKNYEPK